MGSVDAATLEGVMQQVMVGGLSLVRVLAVLAAAPLFSHIGIPAIFKASFALLITLALLPGLPPQPVLDLHPWVLGLLVIKEALIGFFIGFTSSAVLYAARFAGGLLDLDIGFQTALLFDPGLGGFPTLVGEFFAFATLMLFLWLDGPRALVVALSESIRIIPLTTVEFPAIAGPDLIRWVGALTALALNIAAPVMAALFVSLWALALLARTAPQINIFMLSFSVKVIVGIGMLFLSTPLLVVLLRNATQMLQSNVVQLVRALYP
ncbi:MAG: flagellar biosynthetic protein FliR [Candidatus Kapabacteria bacterium]|nr:flagellar biosynthetic protein FliR [Candidatus Kapabacteria bacterium]MCS7169637.1 flagellar biosynthetic protein FliR [Candidatus Kapabacteria bacterium]MDW7996704.1 flagellar biosynthetic protein FliR [Bacteroidota bacterium]MDW8224895.1 flagellar biosynthetic protein FliR [Bacteroidota bacterium]